MPFQQIFHFLTMQWLDHMQSLTLTLRTPPKNKFFIVSILSLFLLHCQISSKILYAHSIHPVFAGMLNIILINLHMSPHEISLVFRKFFHTTCLLFSFLAATFNCYDIVFIFSNIALYGLINDSLMQVSLWCQTQQWCYHVGPLPSYYTKHQQEVCKDFHVRVDWQFHKQHSEPRKSEHCHYLFGVDICLGRQGASHWKVGEDKPLSG